MKVEIIKDKIYIEGIEKKIEELDAKLLESLVIKSIKDQVEFVIESDLPIATFFKSIQEETKPESDLRNKIKQLEKEKDDLKVEFDNIENDYRDGSST